MILHRYLNEHGIDSLSYSKLKVSRPNEINDPFESLPTGIGAWTLENLKSGGLDFNTDIYSKDIVDKLCNQFNSRLLDEGIKKLKVKSDKLLRFISFASTDTAEQDQILLWSHYANKHMGFRFHFDSTKLTNNVNNIKKIIYSKKRATLDITTDPYSPEFRSQLINSWITKSDVWKYENEYRLFVDIEHCKPGAKYSNLSFIKLIPESLIRIDLGAFCSDLSISQIKELLNRNEYTHIKLFRAIFNQTEYKLDYEMIK